MQQAPTIPGSVVHTEPDLTPGSPLFVKLLLGVSRRAQRRGCEVSGREVAFRVERGLGVGCSEAFDEQLLCRNEKLMEGMVLTIADMSRIPQLVAESERRKGEQATASSLSQLLNQR